MSRGFTESETEEAVLGRHESLGYSVLYFWNYHD